MHQLIDSIFTASFGTFGDDGQHDGAVFIPPAGRLAFTTDSYVVNPLFFPGGNIGTLAVYGTVNDLAMCGATPLYLSAGFILEEGLPLETLWQVVQTMAECARIAGVRIVTGDTKVVERGKGDGIYINTAGIGVIEHGQVVALSRIVPGSAVLLSGDIGRHGMAIMSAREGMEFEADLVSDCAPLNGLTAELLQAGIEIHCMRDLTRGGLAGAVIELAQQSGKRIVLEETAISVPAVVRSATELLGLDPLYVANEGRMVCIVPFLDVDRALTIMKRHNFTANLIGQVITADRGDVVLTNRLGVGRMLEMLSGEQLPRIC